ncbi:MAG TPA: hypothetical protein VIL35_09950 [Vicinamibacterales bacterium]
MTHQDINLPPLTDIDLRRGRAQASTDTRTVATRDREAIRRWAERWNAEPATGTAGRDINDGGAEIRFRFPGVSGLQALSWDEWFEVFDAKRLVFVYAEDVSGGPPLRAPQYRLIPEADLAGAGDVT